MSYIFRHSDNFDEIKGPAGVWYRTIQVPKQLIMPKQKYYNGVGTLTLSETLSRRPRVWYECNEAFYSKEHRNSCVIIPSINVHINYNTVTDIFTAKNPLSFSRLAEGLEVRLVQQVLGGSTKNSRRDFRRDSGLVRLVLIL